MICDVDIIKVRLHGRLGIAPYMVGLAWLPAWSAWHGSLCVRSSVIKIERVEGEESFQMKLTTVCQQPQLLLNKLVHCRYCSQRSLCR